MTTKIKLESSTKENVKSKAKELGGLVLQGIALGLGGLIVQGTASKIKSAKNRSVIKENKNILELSSKVSNS